MQPVHFTTIPFELVLQILSFLACDDILSFFATCRSYRQLMSNESVWHELCGRFGVHDLAPFRLHDPNRTFKTVYTELLHAYGPLLGIWASNYPFVGNVIEFRVVAKEQNAGWEGIVGEVWHFPRDVGDSMSAPSAPDYHEFLRIELLSSVDSGTNGRLTRFLWKWHNTDEDGLPTTGTMLANPSDNPLILNGPNEHQFYVFDSREPDSVSMHPEFPPLHLRADTPSHPRVKFRDMKSFTVHMATPQALPTGLLYVAPASSFVSAEPETMPAIVPHSLHLNLPPDSAESALIQSLLSPPYLQDFLGALGMVGFGFGDGASPPSSSLYSGRYFPLKLPTPSRAAERSDHPDRGVPPRELTGLWLGFYETHGTEVLSLHYVEESGEIQAWKVTGDVHVPRGVVSWKFDTRLETRASDLLPNVLASLRADDITGQTPMQFYSGVGTLSTAGYIPSVREEDPLVAAIVNRNEIRIKWSVDDLALTYRRYPGRDVLTENVISEGIRRPTVAF
ncbi:hypothetical protein EIP91_001998 [Steccherinum ochraceum]|uniref:F-box domain-containing protein n=1 Tax=Steccherinum ochraceum TaxID=92696 RepID=A0A4R0RCW9_9APHY|nr:hypothetical protein EIP91_001998 [Steccherinum ochraceum]